MKTNVREKALAVLSEVLGISIPTDDNPNRMALDRWDSLKHMELILRLEEEFHLRFTIEQANEITSLNDIVQMIEVYHES